MPLVAKLPFSLGVYVTVKNQYNLSKRDPLPLSLSFGVNRPLQKVGGGATNTITKKLRSGVKRTGKYSLKHGFNQQVNVLQ